MAAVCALDVGTTRIKALLLDEELSPGPLASVPSVLSTPEPGAAEVDVEALWAQALAAIRQTARASAPVAAVVIANQRATVLPVDDAGHPRGPGLSWQDTRGGTTLATWLQGVGREHFAQVTGLVPSAIWSVSKILWWREHGWPAGTRVATVQDWLLRRLGAGEWMLDPANASLTGLLDIHSLAWDAGLVQAAGLSLEQLPALVPSGTQIGALSAEAASATGLSAGTPLILGGGDQQCANLGAGVWHPGLVTVNLGTAGVVSAPSERVVIDPAGRLVCVAHVLPGRWLLEGLEDAYGGAHRWGQSLLGAPLVDLAGAAPAGSRGLLFFPYLAGSGAPDHDSTARAALLGLTLAHGPADVARAILEGTTIELARIVAATREFLAPRLLVASAGAATHNLLLEMLANLTNLPVALAPHPETALMGAGLLAWLGLRRWPTADAALAALPPRAKTIHPDPQEAATHRALLDRYQATLAVLRKGRTLSLGGAR